MVSKRVMFHPYLAWYVVNPPTDRYLVIRSVLLPHGCLLAPGSFRFCSNWENDDPPVTPVDLGLTGKALVQAEDMSSGLAQLCLSRLATGRPRADSGDSRG